jgi:hypothetical protein
MVKPKRKPSLLHRPDAPGDISRTKIGGILVGAGIILGAVGRYLLGEVDLLSMLQAGAIGVGEILLAIGIRDVF